MKVLDHTPSGYMDPTEHERNLWKLTLKDADVIPPGFRTAEEWGKIWGKSHCTARRIARRLAEIGLMEMRVFRAKLRNMVKQTHHFRAITPNKHTKHAKTARHTKA